MINLALFGAGRMGRLHAENLARHRGARLRYVVDVDPDAARAVAEKYGAEPSTMEAVCEDPSVRAVIIAAPTPTHLELLTSAAQAGKAIFCEKPIDLALDRLDRCLAAVERSGVPFAVGFQRRFDPTFKALRGAVSAGAVGDVEIVRITSRDPHPPPLRYVESSGGLFRDMMIHDFDMARWFLGEEPVEVFAAGSCLVDAGIGRLGDVDTAIAVLRTASGKLCHIENSRRAVYGYDQRLEVLGSRGMLQAGNHSATTAERWTAEGVVRDKPLHFFPERYAEAYAAEIAHFLEAVARDEQPDVGAEAGRQSLLLADAAQRSFETNRPVRVG